MSGWSEKDWVVACSAVFLTLSLGIGAPARAQTEAEKNDGPLGVAIVGWEAEQYWATENYAALDEMFARLASPAERLNDGRWRLAAIPSGLANHFQAHKQWDHMLWQIGEWREKNPQSAAVDIVEAMILREWAWSARGSGYARSVSEEGWKLFTERLRRAEDILLRSKDRCAGNPLWYDEYLSVALGLGWNEAEFRALYRASVSRFPEYQPFYFTMVSYLSPQWHGSVEAIDEYVTEVVKQTQAKQGKIMYARLYWAFAGGAGEDFELFEESGANWADMKAGFEQLLKAYPESLWNLNNFASFSCRARDADTYRKLRKQIGDRPYGDAWPDNLSIEVCDERLLKPI
jgi:hypothetical protein